jgi:hypothetical protein
MVMQLVQFPNIAKESINKIIELIPSTVSHRYSVTRDWVMNLLLQTQFCLDRYIVLFSGVVSSSSNYEDRVALLKHCGAHEKLLYILQTIENSPIYS